MKHCAGWGRQRQGWEGEGGGRGGRRGSGSETRGAVSSKRRPHTTGWLETNYPGERPNHMQLRVPQHIYTHIYNVRMRGPHGQPPAIHPRSTRDRSTLV
eukprot:8033541-Pyramimonas_sp.AAC.1